MKNRTQIKIVMIDIDHAMLISIDQWLKRMKNIDSYTHVRGESVYLDDIPVVNGTLYAAVFDSPVAHGKIRSLDMNEALEYAWCSTNFYC